MATESGNTIEALLEEARVFASPEGFANNAHVNDDSVFAQAAADPEAFWASIADELHWFKKWDQVLDESDPPFFKWFVGGKLNITYNCLDRHLTSWRRNKAAIVWEGEPGDQVVLTYYDLWREVNKFANALKGLGVKRGDRVTLYMGMVPELAIAMLACARIGAPHSIVFGGFSAEALSDRINDAQGNVLVTCDGGWRRGGIVPLKRMADDAVDRCPTIESVVVVKRIGDEAAIEMKEGRDHWWHELMDSADLRCEPEEMDAEDMLYILYTSGTTGKPKGIVHTTGGYSTQTYITTKWVFDLKDEDVYWCTADIGWVTGHSYIVYGPLQNGATTVMYEGAPDFPGRDRFWDIVEKYGITILYTAPTAIRAFMRWGDEWPAKHDMSSLRLLGSVGEPINPEAWIWYQKNIGGDRCPIVDTWWQTETGAILITPLPGYTATKPGSATKTFPGISAAILDEAGNVVPEGGGYLVIQRPWPAMLRTIYGDPERFKEQYWSRYPGLYFTGDGAKIDSDGYFWVLGRVDDVMNVAGHRLSTMEIESALVDHQSVAEAAVIGKTHDLKGQAVSAFVLLIEGVDPGDTLVDELKKHVTQKIGPIARPDDIFFTADLPKTRSGKIMRRLLRDVAEGRALGDTTTLLDANIVDQLRGQYEDSEG